MLSIAENADYLCLVNPIIKRNGLILFEAVDQYYSVNYMNYYRPFTKGDDPTVYEDYNIRYITADKIENLLNNQGITNYLHNHLRNAKPGTNVFIKPWI